ncbi:MAG: tetratricopeptide repeat protein [bacterium]|nr:tetratricopeptide repeat protein [bacterium]
MSPRRLRYWQKTQLVETPPLEGDVSGGEGRSEETEDVSEGYAFRDLVVLRAIVSLVDKGIPLQRIRRNLETLRGRLPEMDDPAAALRLWGEESNRLVVRHDGRLEETGGQLLLEFETDAAVSGGDVASLAEFEAESAKAVKEAMASAGNAVEWFERGCQLDAETSRWAEAIEAYETALEIEPEYADAYCNLGAVRYNQGQRAEARHAFEACLSREADHVEANFNLANVLEEEGDDRGALAHYRRALAADPLYPDLHINLALLYEKVGRPRPSCDHWRRYLQLDPKGSWAEVARMRLGRDSDRA